MRFVPLAISYVGRDHRFSRPTAPRRRDGWVHMPGALNEGVFPLFVASMNSEKVPLPMSPTVAIDVATDLWLWASPRL